MFIDGSKPIDTSAFEGHTPGEWHGSKEFPNARFGGQDVTPIVVDSAEGERVISVVLGIVDEPKANARLMAAAPALLARVQWLEAQLAETKAKLDAENDELTDIISEALNQLGVDPWDWERSIGGLKAAAQELHAATTIEEWGDPPEAGTVADLVFSLRESLAASEAARERLREAAPGAAIQTPIHERNPLVGIVAFLRSCIRSGESLSPEDDAMIDAALAAEPDGEAKPPVGTVWVHQYPCEGDPCECTPRTAGRDER